MGFEFEIFEQGLKTKTKFEIFKVCDNMDVLDMIIDFAESCNGADSYWIDFDGEIHLADMGYAIGFMTDIRNYIEHIGGIEKFKQIWENKKEEMI